MNIFHVKSINRFARILRSVYRPIRNRKNLKFINSEVLKRFGNLNLIHLKNSLVLDLGANRGDFSKWALDQGATVIAFEPDKIVVRAKFTDREWTMWCLKHSTPIARRWFGS